MRSRVVRHGRRPAPGHTPDGPTTTRGRPATEVDASDDRPAHVVGLESGEPAVYRASAQTASSFDDADAPETIDPDGWDRESALYILSEI